MFELSDKIYFDYSKRFLVQLVISDFAEWYRQVSENDSLMKKTKSHSIKLIGMKMDIDKAMNQT
jgi:hypothetical protein